MNTDPQFAEMPLIEIYGVGPDGTCHCPRGKNCKSAGKHPRGDKWQEGGQEPSQFRKGSNIGTLTGEPAGFWVLDIDAPGMAAMRELTDANGPLPRTRVHQTGGGTYHYFFKQPDFDVTNRRGALPVGIDARGTGGQVVLPPSKSSKGAYSVISDEPIADAPEWILDMIRPIATPAAAEPVTPEQSTREAAYEAKAIEGEIGRLRAMAEAATPDGVGYAGEPWDATTYGVACNLFEIANSPWSAFTTEVLEALVRETAPRDGGFGDDEIAAKLSSARRTTGDKARTMPADYMSWLDGEPTRAADDHTADDAASAPAVAPIEAKPPAPARQADAQTVAAHVLARYDLLRTPEGQAFAVPKSGPRLAVSLGEKGGAMRHRVRAEIHEETGNIIGSEALGNGLSVAIARAMAATDSSPMALRVDASPSRIVLDMGRPNDTTCVVIEPGQWRVQASPPEGVYFQRPSSLRPLPLPSTEGSLEPLRELLGFADDSREWLLARGWLVVALRADVPRPMLLPLGAAGAGKTTRGLLAISVLDPRDQLGGSFGRNLDDDRVQAGSRFLVGFDNLSSISEAVSDHLCRVVTGEATEKRRLYSDMDSVVLSYRRTGILTAITLPTLRPDALERVIPLRLESMARGTRRSEAQLRSDFEAAHPSILGAVLDGAATMLERLDTTTSDGPRMLDYWQGLSAYDPVCADAYASSASDVLTDAAEADPLVQAVVSWLRDGVGDGQRENSPSEAHASLTHHAKRLADHDGSWWPRNHRAMSAALTRAAGPMSAAGVSFTTAKSNGARVWRFAYKPLESK